MRAILPLAMIFLTSQISAQTTRSNHDSGNVDSLKIPTIITEVKGIAAGGGTIDVIPKPGLHDSTKVKHNKGGKMMSSQSTTPISFGGGTLKLKESTAELDTSIGSLKVLSTIGEGSSVKESQSESEAIQNPETEDLPNNSNADNEDN